MIMAHHRASRLPDMLLGVQFRTTRRKYQQFQARIGLQNRTDSRTIMPSSPIPKHQNRDARIQVQNLLQEQGRRLRGHQIGTQNRLATCQKVERSIEMSAVALGIGTDDGGLSHRSKNPHERSL